MNYALGELPRAFLFPKKYRHLMKVCAYPGCPELVAIGSRCPKHQRIPWQGTRPYHVGNSMRHRILREEPICRLCGIHPSTRVDHVISRADGGSDERHNLRGICAMCDKKRIGQQAAAGRSKRV